MEFILCADNHFCEKSSVIQGRGDVYSDRLENQIKSLEWVNSFGLPVIHLGDFFDRDILNAEEISCLAEIKKKVNFSTWTFLQGNHGYSGGFDVLNIMDKQIITETKVSKLCDLTVGWLPFKGDPSTIESYVKDNGKLDVLFGHCGIEGIPFGAKGLDPNWVTRQCKLFFNGHLHNPDMFADNCFNIGSLTALNFSDNATQKREKGLEMFNTDEMKSTFYENPYAFNFYKISTFTQKDELNRVFGFDLDKIKRSCFSITCSERLEDEIREKLKSAYYLRVHVMKDKQIIQEEVKNAQTFSIDYMQKFRDKFLEKVGESKIVLDELSEVCNG